jgi:hypothetical protein
VWESGKLWTVNLGALVELVEGNSEKLEVLWNGDDLCRRSQYVLVNYSDSIIMASRV